MHTNKRSHSPSPAVTRARSFGKSMIIRRVPPSPVSGDDRKNWLQEFGRRRCGTPSSSLLLGLFRAQPADGCDRGWNPGLLPARRPAVAAVLLLHVPTQRRPQVSDGRVSPRREGRRQLSAPVIAIEENVLVARLSKMNECILKYLYYMY